MHDQNNEEKLQYIIKSKLFFVFIIETRPNSEKEFPSNATKENGPR